MAFNKGSESTEGAKITFYTGVAPCYVLAVNPTEEKASELLGYDATVAPYTGEVEVDGKKIKTARIDFIVRTDKEKCGVEKTFKLTFFLQRMRKTGSQSGKVQVIDDYGRTAWATEEDIKNKAIPMYSNGPAAIANTYRPAYVGEEELTQFFINFLNIPNVMKWNKKEKKFEGMIDNPSDAEARLDKIEEYFNGNFKELNTLLGYQPNNTVKLLFGVKNKDGKFYQTIYNKATLNNRVTNYNKLAADIADAKNRGGLSNVDYEVCDFKEYTVEPTNFDTPASSTEEVDNSWGY